jgi:hypothetical protein
LCAAHLLAAPFWLTRKATALAPLAGAASIRPRTSLCSNRVALTLYSPTANVGTRQPELHHPVRVKRAYESALARRNYPANRINQVVVAG